MDCISVKGGGPLYPVTGVDLAKIPHLAESRAQQNEARTPEVQNIYEGSEPSEAVTAKNEAKQRL